MSTYRNTCTDCGDSYETESWEPVKCPFCELAQLQAILADPNAVRLNMLRGTIAWTPETLRSVLGEPEPIKDDAERAEFADWLPSASRDLRMNCFGEYMDNSVQMAWLAWTAARAGR